MSKKKNPFSFFDQEVNVKEQKNTEKEQTKEIDKMGNENEQADVTLKRNISTEDKDVIQKSSHKPNDVTETKNRDTKTEPTNEGLKQNVQTEQGNDQGFIEMFREKTKRKTVEETHKRQTFLIDKELIRRLDRLAKRNPRGFKTALVNEGISRMLNEIEKKPR